MTGRRRHVVAEDRLRVAVADLERELGAPLVAPRVVVVLAPAQDVARAVLFCWDSDYTTGALIPVEGGRLIL